MQIPTEAKCRKRMLHEFVLSRNLPDVLIEVCEGCGKKEIWNKRDGRIDNAKYVRSHLRDTVQPFGRTGKIFELLYGLRIAHETRKKLGKIKTKEQHNQEFNEIAQEAKKEVKRRTVGTEVRGTDWN